MNRKNDSTPLIWQRIPAQYTPFLILILGAVFRFTHLGGVRHAYDNSYSAWQALRLIELGEWPIIGQPSSVFLDNPPLMAYIQTVVLLITRSPWSIYILVTAVNTLAIWFLYDLGKQMLGEKAAVIAALLFAINPWVVHFSRQPWTQGLLPFFLIVLAWCIWPTLCGIIQPKRFLFGFVILTALTQTYILAFAIVGPLGLVCLIFYRRWPRPQIWQGSAIFAASLALFWLGLRSQAGRNSSKATSFFSENFLQIRPDALQHAVRYVTGLNYTGQDLINVVPQEPQLLLQLAHYCLLGFLLVGLGTAVMCLGKHPANSPDHKSLAIILLLWGGLPILGLSLFPFMIHPHYQQLTFPALHLLAAWGTLFIVERGRWGYVAVLFMLALFGGRFWLNLDATNKAVAQNPVGWDIDMWALGSVSELGRTVQTITADEPSPIRMVAPSNEQLLSSISGRVADYTIDIDYPDFVVVPGDQPLFYLLQNEPADPTLFGPSAIHLAQYDVSVGSDTTIRFLRVDPLNRDQSGALPQHLVNWPSSSGLTLIGYDLGAETAHAGDTIMVTTYWRVDQLHEARAEWYSAPTYQLVSQEFQILANISEHGQWGHQWRLGDVYIERIEIPLTADLPAGEYRLLIKQFDSVHGLGYPFILHDGTADFVQVPLKIEK